MTLSLIMSLPSAGPALSTSEMAMLGSPLVKWGLSRPPDTWHGKNEEEEEEDARTDKK